MSRTAIVTGGNKGIGLEICRRLLQAGCHVVLAARSKERGTAACDQLKRDNPNYNVRFMSLDLTSQRSIDAFVKGVKESYPTGVDILVNNAAAIFECMDADRTPFGKNARPTFDLNYFGTKYFTDEMLPYIKAAGTISVVASEGGTHSLAKCSKSVQAQYLSRDLSRSSLDALANAYISASERGNHVSKGFANFSYGMSKLAIIAYTRMLALEFEADRSQRKAFSCCPGYTRTDLNHHSGSKSAYEGADTPVWLALSGVSEADNGGFYSDRRCVLSPSETKSGR
eukprot:GFYU01004201.1.p1 GENE.GFYU01004201.1~~GFYU01004201.1.p1  ORF type:complete len:284 (-),score=30.10 GFYU01004201.1:1196-2047(-)